MRARRAWILAGAALSCLACGPGGTETDAGADECFIAAQGDFANYEKWESFDGGINASDGLGLADAQRTLYINQAPPHGSKTFPVGTIIVKTTAGATTFAMAKHGCGFNTSVDGWEWFDLVGPGGAAATGDNPIISWRGTAAPAGNVYGNTLLSCNGCHQGDVANDYVGGASLSLSQF